MLEIYTFGQFHGSSRYIFEVLGPLLTSSHRRINTIFWGERRIGEHLNAHSYFCVFWEPCQHVTHGVPSWHLTCIHAIVSRSPWGHGSVAPDLRHCQQWIPLSKTCSFEVPAKMDLYPIVFDLSLWYAVCLTGCWSIIGRCVGACQLCWRKMTVIKKLAI